MKALIGAFNQETALVGAFFVIVQPVVEPREHYTALYKIRLHRIVHFKVVKTIRQERLLDLVNKSGKTILDGLAELESRFPEVLSRSRGLGTLCAVDVKSADIRDKILHGLKQQGINLGGCGDSTIRIRPSLTFTPRHAHIMLDNLDQVLSKMYNLGN